MEDSIVPSLGESLDMKLEDLKEASKSFNNKVIFIISTNVRQAFEILKDHTNSSYLANKRINELDSYRTSVNLYNRLDIKDDFSISGKVGIGSFRDIVMKEKIPSKFKEDFKKKMTDINYIIENSSSHLFKINLSFNLTENFLDGEKFYINLTFSDKELNWILKKKLNAKLSEINISDGSMIKPWLILSHSLAVLLPKGYQRKIFSSDTYYMLNHIDFLTDIGFKSLRDISDIILKLRMYFINGYIIDNNYAGPRAIKKRIKEKSLVKLKYFLRNKFLSKIRSTREIFYKLEPLNFYFQVRAGLIKIIGEYKEETNISISELYDKIKPISIIDRNLQSKEIENKNTPGSEEVIQDKLRKHEDKLQALKMIGKLLLHKKQSVKAQIDSISEKSESELLSNSLIQQNSVNQNKNLEKKQTKLIEDSLSSSESTPIISKMNQENDQPLSNIKFQKNLEANLDSILNSNQNEYPERGTKKRLRFTSDITCPSDNLVERSISFSKEKEFKSLRMLQNSYKAALKFKSLMKAYHGWYKVRIPVKNQVETIKSNILQLIIKAETNFYWICQLKLDVADRVLNFDKNKDGQMLEDFILTINVFQIAKRKNFDITMKLGDFSEYLKIPRTKVFRFLAQRLNNRIETGNIGEIIKNIIFIKIRKEIQTHSIKNQNYDFHNSKTLIMLKEHENKNRKQLNRWSRKASLTPIIGLKSLKLKKKSNLVKLMPDISMSELKIKELINSSSYRAKNPNLSLKWNNSTLGWNDLVGSKQVYIAETLNYVYGKKTDFSFTFRKITKHNLLSYRVTLHNERDTIDKPKITVIVECHEYILNK